MRSLIVVSRIALALMVLPFCSSAWADGGTWWSNKFQPVQVFSDFDEASQRFKDQESQLLSGQGSHESYLRAGINLSDIACAKWLQSLGKSQRDSNLFKDLMNVAGNVILGVAGINGASSDSLARGSLLLAGGNAAIDTADNAIFFGVVGDVEEKLREGRSISAQVIRNNVPDNYDDAKSMLLTYHMSCSPGAIKNLLKAGLAQVEYVSPIQKLNTAISNAAAQSLIRRLTEEIYGPNVRFNVPQDDLYRLWVLEQVPNDDPSPYIQRMRSPQVVALQAQFRKSPSPSKVGILNQIAGALGYYERYETEAIAQAERANAREEAEVAEAAEDVTRAAENVTNAGLKKLPPELRARLDDPTVLAAEMDERVVKDLKNSSAVLKQSNKSSERSLADKLKVLAEKAEKAKDSDSITRPPRLPSVPPAAPSAVPPASINAILVPKSEVRTTR